MIGIRLLLGLQLASTRLQWKLPDGSYRIITGDLQEKTISAEELIELLSTMLQKKTTR